MTGQPYEAPVLTEIGSMHELTLQLSNKVGFTPDALSAIDPTIVGTRVPASS